MVISFKTTKVFDKNYNALLDNNIRFIINQGGTRSSKTYSICQLLIIYLLTNNDRVVSVVRKTLPSLKSTVMRDFITILKDINIYNKNNHNKSDNIYYFNNNSFVEFFSIDDEQKIRGRKRDICWVNEANEITYDDFFQLNIRTNYKLFFDFNPSDTDSYLYELMNRNDSILIKSTYKDNPFLSDNIRKEIEKLCETDDKYKNVYLYGERYYPDEIIYNKYNIYHNNDIIYDEIIYGLDFGYNHPTALIECKIKENNVYINEKIYESHLTIDDIIIKMNNLNIDKKKFIICDNSRPEYILSLKKAGYNAINANKNIYEGIMTVKKYNLFINYNSKNVIKEIKGYSWKKKNNMIIDEPVKINDDAMDAIRYAIYYYDCLINKPKNIYKIIY